MSDYLKNGELKTNAIKGLVSAHNKGMSWDIKGLKRPELIKFINDKGYKIDHDANKLSLTGSQMKRRPKTIKPIKKSEAEIQSAKDKKEKAKVKKIQKEKVKKIVQEKGVPALPSKETIKKIQQKKKDKKIFTMKAQEDLLKRNKKKNIPNIKDAIEKAKSIKDAKRKLFLKGGGSQPILKSTMKKEDKSFQADSTPFIGKSTIKSAPKNKLDKGQNDFLSGITDIGDSQKVSVEKSIKLLKNIMKNYTGSNKNYDYMGNLLIRLEKKGIFKTSKPPTIKDFKVNKENNKITYKLFDEVYDKFMVRTIHIEPRSK